MSMLDDYRNTEQFERIDLELKDQNARLLERTDKMKVEMDEIWADICKARRRARNVGFIWGVAVSFVCRVVVEWIGGAI